MCSIMGALIPSTTTVRQRFSVNYMLRRIWLSSFERGRDGRGYQIIDADSDSEFKSVIRIEDKRAADIMPTVTASLACAMLGNLRAEPTTEFVLDKSKSDQQPYVCGKWHIVHNGTIANDKELRTNKVATSIDSATIAEILEDVEPELSVFTAAIKRLKGSYAILAVHRDFPDRMFAAVNYRPLWYCFSPEGMFFASSGEFFPPDENPKMMRPYSTAMYTASGYAQTQSLLLKDNFEEETALVVCSGGLDSVVSAAILKSQGFKIHLLHFLYGSRAEEPEAVAVTLVAKALDAALTLFPLPVYRKEDSPLLDPDSQFAGGEAGAEFAHEWVPARNLVLLSVAVAFAEARGYSVVGLGNNLEEAGAYPDNEPEFIARFNAMLPFAVADGKQMRIVMPVGNMMKHEIVAEGHKVGAPMGLTWSCYRAGEYHCGLCGPCYMRRKAFEINNLPEVIKYLD
jgi:7-cyano-7-deazaguanine synthase